MSDDDYSVKLTALSEVKPERVSWLWPGRIPVGKLVTLDGDPGLGKSTLALEFAAVITTGGVWPDGSVCDQHGAVLILSAEDGLADTVRPRLDAAGADVEKVHAVEGVAIVDETGERTLRPPTLADVAALEEAITRTGARLVIIDVLMAYLPSGADAHKDQDIRRVLSRLAEVAEQTGCTVLLLRHLNKAAGRDPLYRGGGSIGIVGAARSGLLVAADPDDPDLRVIASVKSNLGPAPDSLTYRLVPAGDYGVARVRWEGISTRNARDLLTPTVDDSGGPEDERDYTADFKASWLYRYLDAARKEGVKIRPKHAVEFGSDQGISRASVFRLFDMLANAGLAKSVESDTFPRKTYWVAVVDETTVPEPSSQKEGETTETTAPDLHKPGETTAECRTTGETTAKTPPDQAEQPAEPPVVSVVSDDSCEGAPQPPGWLSPEAAARVRDALAKGREKLAANTQADDDEDVGDDDEDVGDDDEDDVSGPEVSR